MLNHTLSAGESAVVNIPVYVARLFLVLHLAFQLYLVFEIKHLDAVEGVLKYLQYAYMAFLWYISWSRQRKDPSSQQKRFIHDAFLIWMLRSYVGIFSHAIADMISLAVVWLFTRSQTRVLSIGRKWENRLDMAFLVFEGLLLVFGIGKSVQPGVILNTSHTLVFTASHLLLILVCFIWYARSAIISHDPTIKARFALLMTAAVLYVGLFLSDFVWRLLVPGASHNLPVAVKDLFGTLGMLVLYVAFNMSDRTRSAILMWNRVYTSQTQQRLISLVLYISEAAAREEDHILPSLAVKVAERLSASTEELQVIRQAAAILVIMHRHELPDLHAQWQGPTPAAGINSVATKRVSPFEDRLTELARVQEVLDCLDVPYAVVKNRALREAEVLRVVLAYLVHGSMDTVAAQRGVEYAAWAVDALVAVVEPPAVNQST